MYMHDCGGAQSSTLPAPLIQQRHGGIWSSCAQCGFKRQGQHGGVDPTDLVWYCEPCWVEEEGVMPSLIDLEKGSVGHLGSFFAVSPWKSTRIPYTPLDAEGFCQVRHTQHSPAEIQKQRTLFNQELTNLGIGVQARERPPPQKEHNSREAPLLPGTRKTSATSRPTNAPNNLQQVKVPTVGLQQIVGLAGMMAAKQRMVPVARKAPSTAHSKHNAQTAAGGRTSSPPAKKKKIDLPDYDEL
eukprot:GEMP01059756.1.p1 GENE.GEMP01059756.1~~GEMP01059756.1.p1  ORF type:complete len:242 (+),score=67.85 GEMP01059756.1:128-853(+)